MLTVYCTSRCGTCRKALKWLDAEGVAHASRDIVEDPPSAALLTELISRSGLPARRFFNTSGNSYRDGGWKDKVADLDVAAAAAALSADGMLIKRPLAFTSDAVLVGFKQPEWEATLGL